MSFLIRPLVPRMEDGLYPYQGYIPTFIMFLVMWLSAISLNAQRTSLTCYGRLNISLPENGMIILHPEDLTRTSDLSNLIVQVIGTNGNTIDCQSANTIVMVSVIDTLYKINCMTEILVEDKSDLVLSCRDTLISCLLDPDDPSLQSVLSIKDNCATINTVNISWNNNEPVAVYSSTTGDTVGMVNREWVVTDPISGKSFTCNSKIYLSGIDIASIVFPKDTTIYSGMNARDSTITGLIANADHITSQCNIGLASRILPSVLNNGCYEKYQREWVIKDWNNPMLPARMDTQLIKVIDTSTLIFIAPEPQIIEFDTSLCMVRVKLSEAQFAGTNVIQYKGQIGVWVDGKSYDVCDTILLDNSEHEIVYTLNTNPCIYNYKPDTLTKQYSFDFAPVLDCNSICHVTAPIEQDVSVDSLYDKAIINSCDNINVSLMARKVVERCSPADTIFSNKLRFCLADLMQDSVLIEIKAVNASGESSVCRKYISPQDKVAPSFSINLPITLDVGPNKLVTLDSAVFFTMLADNSKFIKSVRITGSGSSKMGTTFMTGSGWPILSNAGFIDFNCDDVGEYTVTVTACDYSMNCTSQSTLFTITDNAMVCPMAGSGTSLAMRFRTFDGDPLSGVSLYIEGSELTIDTLVDISGDLVINSTLHNDSTYMLTFGKDEPWSSGLTSADLTTLQQFVMGMITFNDTAQYIAADINSDGMIGAMDIIELIKILTDQPSANLAKAYPWVFGELKSEMLQLCPNNQLEFHHESIDKTMRIIGIKKGSIALGATTPFQSTSRSTKLIEWYSLNAQENNGENTLVLMLPNFAREAQFSIDLKNLDIDRVISSSSYVSAQVDDKLIFIGNDLSRADRSIEIVIKGNVPQELNMSELLDAFVISEDERLYDLQMKKIDRKKVESLNESESVRIYPNPFAEEFNVDLSNLNLSLKESYDLKVIDPIGREIISEKHSYDGIEKVKVKLPKGLPSGSYRLIISTSYKTTNKHMLKY